MKEIETMKSIGKLSDEINSDHSRCTGKKYLCQRTGRYVPAENPVCQVPDKACKYRIDCIIYALQEDERVTIQKHVEEIDRG